MASLTRVLQNLFGVSHGTDEVAQFGSLANGTPTYSDDPTVIQALNQFAEGLFSVTGTASQSPRIEDFNALFLLLFRQLKYLFQSGVAEWIATENYFANKSIVTRNGRLYIALSGTDVTPNLNIDPETDTGANWKHIVSATDENQFTISPIDTVGGQWFPIARVTVDGYGGSSGKIISTGSGTTSGGGSRWIVEAYIQAYWSQPIPTAGQVPFFHLDILTAEGLNSHSDIQFIWDHLGTDNSSGVLYIKNPAQYGGASSIILDAQPGSQLTLLGASPISAPPAGTLSLPNIFMPNTYLTGSGNGLDADTVDGLHASAFSSAFISLSAINIQTWLDSQPDASSGFGIANKLVTGMPASDYWLFEYSKNDINAETIKAIRNSKTPDVWMMSKQVTWGGWIQIYTSINEDPAIATETTRAESAESTLTSNLNAEISRAETAEGLLVPKNAENQFASFPDLTDGSTGSWFPIATLSIGGWSGISAKIIVTSDGYSSSTRGHWALELLITACWSQPNPTASVAPPFNLEVLTSLGNINPKTDIQFVWTNLGATLSEGTLYVKNNLPYGGAKAIFLDYIPGPSLILNSGASQVASLPSGTAVGPTNYQPNAYATGSGNGLDADTVDGLHASSLAIVEQLPANTDISLPLTPGLYSVVYPCVNGPEGPQNGNLVALQYDGTDYACLWFPLANDKIWFGHNGAWTQILTSDSGLFAPSPATGQTHDYFNIASVTLDACNVGETRFVSYYNSGSGTTWTLPAGGVYQYVFTATNKSGESPGGTVIGNFGGSYGAIIYRRIS